MWIERRISSVVRRLLTQRPALVLTGARQTGKTSLVTRLFPHMHSVRLDLPHLAAQAENEPAQLLLDHPPPLFLDEVQYAPKLFRHLKVAIDDRRDQVGQFVLTGSQKFVLMREVSDSLAGRTAVLELEPLSFVEIHDALPSQNIDEVIVRGGYPELYARLDLDAHEYYASYLVTYLERDVRSLLRVGSLRDFERFVRACALRSAQLLNKSELARDVGISPSTASEWLSVLQASGQIHLVEPWFGNATRSMTKSPKLYVSDTGLLCFLLGIRSPVELGRSPYRGAVWETFVQTELRKRYALAAHGDAIYFFRDRAREVDFLLHRGGRFELLEAKWTEQPTARDASAFAPVAEQLGAERIVARTIVCRTPDAFSSNAGWRAVGPTHTWFDGDG